VRKALAVCRLFSRGILVKARSVIVFDEFPRPVIDSVTIFVLPYTCADSKLMSATT
jgi:hypothetical protein